MAGIEVAALTHFFSIERERRLIGLRVIDDLSLTVRAGEFVSIVGPSGCGKTTLLDIIAGLTPYQHGRVAIANRKPHAGRKDIAYMFANDCLLPWRTALQNAVFGMELRGFARKERFDRARSLLAEAGLSGFEDAFVSQLSKGMRQRVALARTFGLNCEYLFMDEPFGALDPQTKLLLQQQLLQLWEGHESRTILFITHDLGEAIVMSDRVIVLTRRPARIKADLRIDLPRPRIARDLLRMPEYHQIYAQLWQELGDEIGETPESGYGM